MLFGPLIRDACDFDPDLAAVVALAGALGYGCPRPAGGLVEADTCKWLLGFAEALGALVAACCFSAASMICRGHSSVRPSDQ